MKWEAVSKLARALWSLVVFENILYPTKGRMKNWSPSNFKMLRISPTADLREREAGLGATRPNRKLFSEDPRSSQAAPQAGDVHSMAKRINRGSTSEGNQSGS